MVGVPGRSKGCLTCRKRKKGCDQQRPVCGQCRRSNLVCHGYPSDLTFVRYSPNRVGPSHFSAETQGGHPANALVAQTPSPGSSADQSLVTTAVDVYMFDNCWHSFFPIAKEEETRWIPKGEYISSWIPAGWFFDIRDYCNSHTLIRMGMQANAYAMYGKNSNDKRLRVASIQAYSMVLQEVHRGLQDPSRRTDDSLLAACKLLSIYEALQGAGLNWERHALGIVRLLQVRGPETHQTGLAHSMFLDARYQGVVANIRRREPSFLCHEEWCTVPYAVVGKDYRHTMIDIMANIPRLQFEYDNLKSALIPGFDTPDRRKAYFELCKSLRQDLDNWFERLKSKFDVERIALIEQGIPDNFPLSNIMLAHAMTLYWASMLLVNVSWLHGLRDVPVPSIMVETNDSDTMPNIEIMPYIMSIARSIPYFFQLDAGSICPQSFSFPLGVALSIAAYTNAQAVPEYRRLLKAFSKGPMGKVIQKFLVSLQLLADPNTRAPVDSTDSSEDEPMKASYEEIRRNSVKYHDEGIFIQRPLTNVH